MQKMGYFEEQISQYLKISGDTTVTKIHGNFSKNRTTMIQTYEEIIRH